MTQGERDGRPIHYPTLRIETYAGKEPNTEVRIMHFAWGVCSSVLDYETGELLAHVDLLIKQHD